MNRQTYDSRRRHMLKSLVVASTTTMVSTMVTPVSASSEKPTVNTNNGNYRETEHIRAYYASLS